MEDQVLSSPNLTQDDKVRIEPCTHEEADTRIMLHVADAAEHGFKKIMVRTVDPDVVVILISHIQDILAQEVWIAFGIVRITVLFMPMKSLPNWEQASLKHF